MNFTILAGTSVFPIPHLPLFVARVANASNPRHGHDFQEFVLVAKGGATQWHFAPQTDESRRDELSEGDIFWVPVGWSHHYQTNGTFEIYNILFDAAILGDWPLEGDVNSLFRGLRNPDAAGECGLIQPFRLRRGERETLEGLLRVVMRELTLQRAGFAVAARAKLAEFLVLLQRIHAQQNLGSHALWDKSSPMARAISYIEEHFAEPITLRDIARAVHLSPNYFCEQFKMSVGQTPGAYLLSLRLEHARFLLITTSFSVTQIAHESGFSDPSYFARAFKAAFGATPLHFRATGK